MYKILKFLLATSAIATLAACGGGGGGETATTPSPVVAAVNVAFPVKVAFTNQFLNSSSRPFMLSGLSSGRSVSGSGTVTRGTPVSSTFEGFPALRKTTTVTGSFVVGANSFPLSTVSNSFTDTNINPFGYSNDGEYAVVSGTVNIPTTAVINDTGIIYTADTFTTSSKAVRTGTNTVSFVLQPETGTTGLLSIISVQRNVAGATTVTSTQRLRIDTSGAITFLNESALFSNGNSLTFNY